MYIPEPPKHLKHEKENPVNDVRQRMAFYVMGMFFTVALTLLPIAATSALWWIKSVCDTPIYVENGYVASCMIAGILFCLGAIVSFAGAAAK